MTERRTLKNRLLETGTVKKIAAILGIDMRQYGLLLDLFDALSSRMDFMGRIVEMRKVVGWYFAFSLLISLIVFTTRTLSAYLLFMLGYSMFAVFFILMMDAANSIMNPDEASVLAHQPIRGSTYIAAKLTHLLVTVAAIVPSLNLVPAIAGLYFPESRWFYPLTHLMAAYLAGLFVAFFVCGIYGWLFLFISPAKAKNAALWMQLASLIVVPIVYNLNMYLGIENLVQTHGISRALGSSWMPWRWFVAMGLLGHPQYSAFSPWEAAAACLMTLGLIALGLRGFRADYMARVSALIQGSAASSTRSSRTPFLGSFARALIGAPSGYGAFAFVSAMMRRDWHFRRQALPLILGYLFVPLVLAVRGIHISPFAPQMFSPLHVLPHLLGFIVAVICILISYTAEPQSSSVFVSLPLEKFGPFVRGIYLSLWMPAGIMHLCLLPACMWFWGAVEGALFVSFSAALAAVYLSIAVLFVDGLPFANPFKPSTGYSLPMVLLIMLIPVLLFAAIQWLVFHSVFLVLATTMALACLAFGIGHFSLARMEKKFRANLQLLGFGPQHMFKGLEQ